MHCFCFSFADQINYFSGLCLNFFTEEMTVMPNIKSSRTGRGDQDGEHM